MASRITTYLIVLIVAGTLVAGLIVGAQRDAADGPVDLIITNGKVYTGGNGNFAEAVAVRGNKILRVGSNREIKRLRRPQTLTLDAHGATVLPGFNDSHIHLLSGGLSLAHLDLLEATTLDQIQTAIRDYAAADPERPWVRGRGWYYEPFAGGLPTRQQLDLLVPDRPAYFTSYDGHTGWANTRALAAAGITRRTPNPKNGTIVKDPRTGQPTGVLKETAMGLVGKVLPPVTRDEQLTALRRARDLAHSQGVTSVQNAGGSVDDFPLYDELRKQGELDLRVYDAISAASGLSDAELAKFETVRTEFADDPVLKAGAVKLMLDGVVESHTAAMLEPYANRETTGQINFTQAELDRVVALLDKRGWQIFIHAIGDRGIRAALDAYERAAKVIASNTSRPSTPPTSLALAHLASSRPSSPTTAARHRIRSRSGRPTSVSRARVVRGSTTACCRAAPTLPSAVTGPWCRSTRGWACTSPPRGPRSTGCPRAAGSLRSA
jgi:predicted amidohydrolase YtcJ